MEKEYIERRITHWITMGIKFIVFAAVYVTVCGFAVMYLWNWLAPPIIQAAEINFLQAVGILTLAKILFGGKGWGGKGHYRKHRHAGGWREKWEEKWEKMTPEEQAKMKEKWGKCGPGWGKWQGESRKAETKAESRAQNASAKPATPAEPFSPVNDHDDQPGA